MPSTPCSRAPRAARGFTATELLVALALAALLAAAGVPALQRFAADAALGAATSALLAGLHEARAAALARGSVATLCLSADDDTCGGTSLPGGGGLLVFTNGDSGSSALREAGEPVVRRHPLPRAVMLHGTRGWAAYQPLPRSGTTVTFTLCHARGLAAPRQVVVSQSGRPRVVRYAAEYGSGATSTRWPAVCRR